jgi:hypothetical protein
MEVALKMFVMLGMADDQRDAEDKLDVEDEHDGNDKRHGKDEYDNKDIWHAEYVADSTSKIHVKHCLR